MAIEGIRKITKEDIQKLNENNAIYKTRNDMENGNSTNINIDFFSDGQDIYIDSQGRIVEKQDNNKEVYMGWADKNKLNNKVNINSAYDYYEKFPEKNNNNLVNEKLNKNSGNTFNSNISNIKVYDAPIEVDRSAIDNKKEEKSVNSFADALKNVDNYITAKINDNTNKTRVYDAPIEVDRSAIDNKTRVYDAPIEVDRSAIDNKKEEQEKNNNFQNSLHNIEKYVSDKIENYKSRVKVYDAPIEVDRSAIDKKTVVYDAPIEVDRSAIDKKETPTTQKTEKPIENIKITPIKEEVKNEEVKKEEVIDNQPKENVEEIENIETFADNQEEQIVPETTSDSGYEDKYTILAKDTLEGINEKRREYGLPDLIWDDELVQAASIRAAEASQMWSHTRPNGQQYNSVSDAVMGENLAKNYPDAATTIEAWMNSESHRANILDKDLRTVGIAVVETDDGQIFYAADFGEKI